MTKPRSSATLNHAEPGSAPPNVTPNVLIVDDSLTVRMDLAEALGAAGFGVTLSATAREARAALESVSVDVLVLDVVLPDGDGVDLLREVRTRAATQNLPVILLSTEADVRDRIRGLTTGADAYVGKPYDAWYVVAKAGELLRKRGCSPRLKRPILLIDDSPTFRDELEETLRESGYEVVTAETGEDGLRIAAAQRPEAMIVDGVLPGIDGATVIRRIRLDAELRTLPCILLTAASSQGAELHALESGADAFVEKGDDLAVVLAKLKVALRGAAHAGEDPTEQISPKRVLAVDDNLSYLSEVSSALRSDGYDVLSARGGEEALELLALETVDCVLLDLVSPGMSGIETCRRIKANPDWNDTAIIVLTGVEDRATMLEALAVGADDYIQKSAEFDVLKARVRAQLRRRQFEEQTRRAREQQLQSELEIAEARASRTLAETRAQMVEELELKNRELEHAYADLKATQSKLIQAAKMASLGELVAGVAHEINNPLAFAVSHLETARRNLTKVNATEGERFAQPSREAWDRADNRLREMTLGLDRIRDLVLKLRAFSRLDEGERKLVSVRESVDSILTILGHRLRNGITLSTNFDAKDQLDCAPGLLNQAVMNLITNAIDAMGERGNLSISTATNGQEFVIAVADDGHGIPENLRERVFEPFFTTKPVGEGTGLGLSITYSIVQKHGGTLELTPAPGGGTVARIRLPLSPTGEP